MIRDYNEIPLANDCFDALSFTTTTQQAGSILHIIKDRNTYDNFAHRSYLRNHHHRHIANFLEYM